jgi:hypothetical protein
MEKQPYEPGYRPEQVAVRAATRPLILACGEAGQMFLSK